MNISPPSPSLPPTSPKWGQNIKLIIGLSLVALVASLIIYFRAIIGPLLLSFILVYLLYPVVKKVTQWTNLTWRGSVNVIYLLLVVLLLGTFTLTGLAVVQQVQNLIAVISNFLENLPNLIADMSNQVYSIGPFQFSLEQYDLASLSEQLLGQIQPLVGQVGSLVSTFATSAVSTIGWALFVLVVSYFILAESRQVTGEVLHIEIPGYDYDVQRLVLELRRIWNAFLRGQLILFGLVAISYTILMTVLGVRYSYAIGLLAGLARFVPYLGAFTTWVVLALVTFFQSSNYLGLDPLQYTLLAFGAGFILDQIFDNLVSPRVYSQTLRIHPAAVLVAAIVAAKMIGIIGLVVAAPTLATIKLFGQYMVRKMFDLDPWPAIDEETAPPRTTQEPAAIRRLREWYEDIKEKNRRSTRG